LKISKQILPFCVTLSLTSAFLIIKMIPNEKKKHFFFSDCQRERLQNVS
jgi:hypothetical protein